jgi:hypothetical protein
MSNRYLVILSVTLSMLLSFGCSTQHPTDDTLLANFQSHKTEFNQLLQMFFADKGLGRVAKEFTRPANPADVKVTAERLSEYRQLFNKLDLRAGIEGYGQKDVITFYASTQGLAVSGSSKGFAYLKDPPKLLVEKLDGYRSPDGKSFTAFRHIEGNWYLFLEYED